MKKKRAEMKKRVKHSVEVKFVNGEELEEAFIQ